MTETRDYPEARYLGEGGEVSARIRRVSNPPDLELPGGTTVHYLATGDATDGLFGLYRWELGVNPGGAAPHFHHTIAESFFILSGTVQLYDGTAWVDAVPGDYAYVPPGGVHGFRNQSGTPASMLILFSPGAPREAYFQGPPRLAEMTDDERAEFFRHHDNLYVDG